MISYLIDGVLLLALLLTSLRVGAMYRELKRLRGYQVQYVEVFGQTSRAADQIGEAVRHLGKDARDVLERLEVAVAAGRELAGRLEAASRWSSEPATRDAGAPDDVGTYSRRGLVGGPAAEGDSVRFKNEILKFGGDNQRLPDRREDGAGMTPSPRPQPSREFRMAPSVKTVRAAGGNG